MKQNPAIGLQMSFIGLVLIILALIPITSFADPTTLKEFEAIDRGFKLFTEETFEGNGRSCGVCHIPDAQYNINPNDIRRASWKERKLIFATSTPGLENPILVKKLALFNVEGGDALNPEIGEEGHHPVFRGSMTVGPLALTTQGPPLPPGLPMSSALKPRTGWAGNGSPGAPEFTTPGGMTIPADNFHHGQFDENADGSIRAFANGAIAQHNPITLKRIAKTTACPDLSIDDPHAYCDKPYDFRFASNAELDDMEAFQNWLGRRDELRIETLKFKNKHVIKGKALYMSNQASCNVCHADGGANFRAAARAPVPSVNIAQHSDINALAEELSELTGVFIPEDPGLNVDPPGPNPGGPFAFNGQPVIEAARKEAFFHNHGFRGSIEKASEFYFTDTFINSEIGIALQGLLTGPAQGGDGTGIGHLTTIEDFLAFGGKNAFNEMGAFARALAAWYSLKDCERLIDEAILRMDKGAKIKNPLLHCTFNLGDTHKVLIRAKVRYLHRGIAKKSLWLKYALYSIWADHKYGVPHKKTIKRLELVKKKITKLRGKIAIIETPTTIASTDS